MPRRKFSPSVSCCCCSQCCCFFPVYMTTKCCQLNFLIMLNLANGAQSTSLGRHVISLSARAIQQHQQQLERRCLPLGPQLCPLRPVFPVFPSSRANNIVQIYRHLHGAWHWNCKLATHRERRWQHTLTHTPAHTLTYTYTHLLTCVCLQDVYKYVVCSEIGELKAQEAIRA